MLWTIDSQEETQHYRKYLKFDNLETSSGNMFFMNFSYLLSLLGSLVVYTVILIQTENDWNKIKSNIYPNCRITFKLVR